MKKVLILTLAISLVIAGIALATVVSTKHDMRLKGTSVTTTQVCVFCHHPHRGVAADNTSNVLLWNINGGASTSYNTYNSPTAILGGDNTLGTDNNAQYSRLCMTCHDGAVASTAYIAATSGGGSLGSLTITGIANLGSTLVDDHPVDFAYADGTNGDIKAKSDDTKVVGNISSVDYSLYGGTMQCATCHDVHNGQSPKIEFMRGGSTDVISDSKICRDCHQSK